ncbi:hypothetical protein GCM10015535_67640 [Streptomyces gelaticus]|uniref:Uncharacterized protein n=1 Tax=Streptomyces gelaticus TaxID=285446 RepID=A0ABQ2WAX6_9ACTN|nr:hypothetical protein GCM10015535_67640 [Streptomyces gelaticus]
MSVSSSRPTPREHRPCPRIEDFVKHYAKGPVHTKLSFTAGGSHNAKTHVPNMEAGELIQ